MTRPDLAWYQWISDATTSSTATYVTDLVWSTWNATSGTNSLTYDRTWEYWVTSTAGNPCGQALPALKLTPAELAERKRVHAEQQRLWAEQQAKEEASRQAARLRAEVILRKHLTPAQKRQRTMHGWFHVRGPSGALYRIHTSGALGHNVRLMERQRPWKPLRAVASLCAYPRGVSAADAFLAQLLFLQHDEQTFLRTAYRNDYPGPQRQ